MKTDETLTTTQDSSSQSTLPLAICWGIVLLICAIYSSAKVISGNGFESNILSLIPDQLTPVENQQVKEQLRQQVERHFIILLKGTNSNEGLQLAKALKTQLQTVPGVVESTPDFEREKAIKDFYFPFRYQLLSSEVRNELQTLTPQQIADRQLQALHSPIRSYAPYPFEEDPFNLGGRWIQSIISMDDRFVATEIPSVKDQQDTWYLINGELQLSPFNPELQQQLIGLLDDFMQQHGGQPFELLTSGLVFHAAQGTKIAQTEISTVGVGSLLAVITLVLFVFRSAKSFLFILLILASSMLIALSVTWLCFDRVHLVTLAFGSTLLGLAADYSFHFLVKMRATGNPLFARKLLFKGLVISCLSSMVAYLIQLFSPFPGLHQFAVFVASGLLAACVTVILFGVLFKPVCPLPIPVGRAFGTLFEPAYRKLASMGAWVVAMILVITLLAIFNLYRQGVTDDVRLLNTSGLQLIESEQKVQQLLGNFSTQRYILLEGQSPQWVLEQAESLEKQISGKLQIAAAQVLVSPAAVVPSLLQQQVDYELIQDKIFSEQGAAVLLCQALQNDCDWLMPLPAFNVQMSPDNMPQLLMSLSPSLTLLKNSTVIIFFRDEKLADEIVGLDLQLFGVTYVDQVENLTSILKNFRQQVSWLLGGFYGCLIILSLIIFARRGILIVTSVIFSSVIALSAAAGSGITLFHVLALLLVIGITVDTAVFYITPGLDRDTWTAATLAALTSVIAFGLLSLSQVPLLNQFGSVVFYGLICAWLVTPVIYYLLENNQKNRADQTGLIK